MNARRIAAVIAALFAAALAFAASPPPVLRMPDAPERPIPPDSLVGAGRRDVRVEGSSGDVVVYHGMPLIEVLEKGGLDAKTMPAQRRLAAAIVVATARDGYTAAFSVGELLQSRADPRVFLVSESAAGPLSDEQGPVRLIVLGDRARSPYGLARIEMKLLSDNPPAKKH
jgi:hypothetical protein